MIPETYPQPKCIEAGCEHGAQRCSQPSIDCDSQVTSWFAVQAGITTKVVKSDYQPGPVPGWLY